MKRTQIYLDDTTYTFLKKESRMKKKSMSEIIRESINSRMKANIDNILKRTDDVAGSWKDRKFNIEKYIRDSRKDRER